MFELFEAMANRFGWNHDDNAHARNLASSRLALVGKALAAFLFGAVLGGYLAGRRRHLLRRDPDGRSLGPIAALRP